MQQMPYYQVAELVAEADKLYKEELAELSPKKFFAKIKEYHEYTQLRLVICMSKNHDQFWVNCTPYTTWLVDSMSFLKDEKLRDNIDSVFNIPLQ